MFTSSTSPCSAAHGARHRGLVASGRLTSVPLNALLFVVIPPASAPPLSNNSCNSCVFRSSSCRASVPPSARWTRPSPRPSRPTPTHRCSRRCYGSAKSSSPRSSTELGPTLERSQICEQFIAEMRVVVPVAEAPGMSRTVPLRCATNRQTRLAITLFADNSRHGSDWPAKICDDPRPARSDSFMPPAPSPAHRSACGVGWRRDGTCYDPRPPQPTGRSIRLLIPPKRHRR